MADTVPYQAYRSKRHTPSNSNSQLTPNVSLPRPHQNMTSGKEKDSATDYRFSGRNNELLTSHVLEDNKPQRDLNGLHTPPDSTNDHELLVSTTLSSSHRGPISDAELSIVSNPPVISNPPKSPSDNESQPAPLRNKRASTFRHVALRNARTPTSPSSLGPQSHTPVHSRYVSMSSIKHTLHETNSNMQLARAPNSKNKPAITCLDPAITSLDSLGSDGTRHDLAATPVDLSLPAANAPVRQHALEISTNTIHNTTTSTSSLLTSVQQRTSAPYRPGFQPGGVRWPLTDDFIALRRAKQEGGGHGSNKAERRKLERRLEKLIAIHFPLPSVDSEVTVRRGNVKERPGVVLGRPENWRISSLVDFDARSITIKDTVLWRGIFGSDDSMSIRDAERRITPWQADADINKCPLCGTSFHPLTNRKHHCRLCGQIICSLAPKLPHRPTTCSLLFVVDPETRKIEEVGEGVDYGVKKRKVDIKRKVEDHLEEDKFLKGIRICRTCRPVLLHKLHQHDIAHVPVFVKLYEAFVSLEHEIEEYVPQFQELILSLSHHNQPTKEASSMRKRLMEAFAQYDVLAKRIRKLPCPNGPGSSQDRVQMAVMTRANLFLQMNMVPLQSLSSPTRDTTVPSKNSTSTKSDESDMGDADSKVALALQPLLEQEALLESFVEEAQAQRKFEDVKALKVNLGEIRAEIEKIFANVNT